MENDETSAAHRIKGGVHLRDEGVHLGATRCCVGKICACIVRISDRKLGCDYVEPIRGILR